MVNPLDTFTIESNAMGAELDLSWTLPGVLPTNYKVYVFQRSRTDVDQANDIDRYFTNINDLSNYDYKGCFVFDKIETYET